MKGGVLWCIGGFDSREAGFDSRAAVLCKGGGWERSSCRVQEFSELENGLKTKKRGFFPESALFLFYVPGIIETFFLPEFQG